MSIQEDYTERWIAVRAKALYNFDVFPPCMIIQIVGFLAEAFPKVFSCVSCVFILLLLVICVHLDLSQSLSFRKLIVEVDYSILLWYIALSG